MSFKNLKNIALFILISISVISCSDDEVSENLLYNHVWNYGQSQNTFVSNNITYTVSSRFEGTMTFNSNNSYSNNIISGNIVIIRNNSGLPPQTIVVEPIVETGNFEYQDGPIKLITTSNTTPSVVSNYYIHEITSSKLILKRKLEEIGIQNSEDFFYITLTR